MVKKRKAPKEERGRTGKLPSGRAESSSTPKKKPSTKNEMNRFQLRPKPAAIQNLFRQQLSVSILDQLPIPIPDCEPAVEVLNRALNEGCALRSEFVVEGHRGCISSAPAGSSLVDLAVIIDTSGSMSKEATDLSNDAAEAVKNAQQSCPSDLRVCWFGIEGTWADTKFTQSYRNYLQGQITSNRDDCRYSGTPVPGSDIRGYEGDREDGAAAIMDLAEHFDWRPGTARAVLFLGDEALERGGSQDSEDYAAANAAIEVAQARGVTVFTYFGTPIYHDTAAETAAEYRRVATETGGQFFNAPSGNLGGFQAILEQIICASARGSCSEVRLPSIRPCFRLMWGDGPNDRIETDDLELMCISAINPYSNITIKNLTVLVSLITKEDGSDVESLPDRTKAVYLKPLYVTCFGDIPPCDWDNGNISAVTREFALVSRGAKEGKYHLNIIYCYSIALTFLDLDWFEISLVKS